METKGKMKCPKVDKVVLLSCTMQHRCLFLFQFYLQDTKSSNGTFVNNVRLSKGSEESEPKEIKSGDIVQFGVDVVENSKKGNCLFFFKVLVTNM